jgi:hypothetical protein
MRPPADPGFPPEPRGLPPGVSINPDTALITGVVALASGAHGDKVRGGLTLTCTFPSPDLAASESLVWAPVWPPAWARQ